jgi:hypothetical protein
LRKIYNIAQAIVKVYLKTKLMGKQYTIFKINTAFCFYQFLFFHFLFLGVAAVVGKCFGKLKTTAFYKVKHSVSLGIFEINSSMLIK